MVPLNVSQVPPPVTSSGSSGLKVPEPVSLIDKLLGFLAEAKATPPGLSVLGVVAGFMWMISQRTWSAAARATGSQTGIANNPAKVTMAVTKIHFVAIFMFLLLAKFLTRRNSVAPVSREDRKSTRLNSSHPSISYAVFC